MIDVLQAFPLPSFVVAPNEIITAINSKAEDLLGQTTKGRHYLRSIRSPDVADAIDYVLQNGGDRQTRWLTTISEIDLTYMVFVSGIEEGAALVSLEDTSHVETSRKMRRDFVTNVSHELKTPLTSMLGFLETLQTTAQTDPVAQQRFLEIMTNEAKRMNRLVDDLLSLNRVESEERTKPAESVDLNALLIATKENLSPLNEKTNTQIKLTLPDEQIEIAGHSDQLTQVIVNLIENAIKYGGSDKDIMVNLGPVDYQSTLRCDGVCLSVTDFGPGIERSHIPRLTERFYRIDHHRSREIGGTGLGLSIVKHIINRHRGRLKVTSEIGFGSTFSVFLPKS